MRSVKRLCLPQEIVARLHVHKTDAIIRSLGTAGTVKFVKKPFLFGGLVPCIVGWKPILTVPERSALSSRSVAFALLESSVP